MTKLIIVNKNEKGLIEISEDALKQALEEAQEEAYKEGLQLGILKGQAAFLASSLPKHECKCHHNEEDEEDGISGECHNSKE